MEALQSDEILGNWAPLLIPFDAQGRVARRRLEAQLEALVGFEVDGIASGLEVESLTDEEFHWVHGTLARRCDAAGVPFMIATHAATIQASVQRMLRAASHAPGAFRVRIPDARSFDARRAARHLEDHAAVCDGVGLVWELTAEQQRALDGAALARILENQPALFGLDLAVCDEDLLEALRPFEDELSIFVPGETLASGWRRGACGSVSLLACLDPGHAQGYFEALQDHLAPALDFELRAQRFLEAHMGRITPAGRAKLLCAIGGWCEVGLSTRGPDGDVGRIDVVRLRALAREALPEF